MFVIQLKRFTVKRVQRDNINNIISLGNFNNNHYYQH